MRWVEKESFVVTDFWWSPIVGIRGINTDKENVPKIKRTLNEVEEWRKKHGVQFETPKYVLVHYTRNRHVETKAPVTINGITIRPSDEAKYLGVYSTKNHDSNRIYSMLSKKVLMQQWHYPASQKAPGELHTYMCDNYFKRSLRPISTMQL